ncbi:hypothetical protein C900_01832 [Fulvivirga imtechensis AK7]|uniref:eCIS core domain-containing protein n=1 Tax=Fulvivirga imtechensis AK7 TaxID=1237149 RepID=L8JTD0_9BACT|nr:DUF4157 domain-containing protein [Fulvivirga imtechensis]ELR72090.1 hypothetical protein C900_01832 [Fulvivirga imtechensis AK7]
MLQLATTRENFIQRRLEIGQPDDKYEKEADAVADRVMRMPSSRSFQMTSGTQSPGIQMKCAKCEEEEKLQMKPMSKGGDFLQMKSANKVMTASEGLRGMVNSSKGSGQSLPEGVNNEMSGKMGADFSKVKVHTDSNAIQMSRELGAQAFTYGSDIYFDQGKYDPGSSAGKHLLAHELTHVVQQNDTIQRSCHDGNCDSCAGGVKDFWVTFFFRVRATRRVMSTLRTMINEAKRILADCCLNLKADFNWDLLGGDRDVDPFTMNPDGTWHYNPSVTDVGESNAFASARGVPILVVDNVQKSGGGITVGSAFDTAYTGVEYFVLAVNQINSNPNCNHLAHELWHVGSDTGRHNAAADGSLAACTGNDVSPGYCSGLRAMV